MQKHQMSQILYHYVKFIFAFSITLLIIGSILEVQNQFKTTTPVIEVEKEKLDETVVSVTPADEAVPISSVLETDTNPVTNSQKEKKLQDTNSSEIVETPTIEELNDALRKEIQKDYGIVVYYGKETDNYRVTTRDIDIRSFSIMNPTTIHNQLLALRKTLTLYPAQLFWEIREGGIPLSVYLIDHYTDKTVTGITDSTYNYAHISIAAIYSFEESFFHESYHYIERYLLKKGANFNSWDSLNPGDFRYGVASSQLSYSNTFSEDAFFVNNYAQTASGEDRASTFEYMMAPNKASCLNENKPVWSKARYMSLTIETVLNSVKPEVTEYWERYL